MSNVSSLTAVPISSLLSNFVRFMYEIIKSPSALFLFMTSAQLDSAYTDHYTRTDPQQTHRTNVDQDGG